MFEISGTADTPYILFSPADSIYLISGRSLPENSPVFYEPVLDWLDNFIIEENSQFVLEVKLEYFNTASSKSLMKIIKRVEHFFQQQVSGSIIKINWYYLEEDIDMLKAGERISLLFSIDVHLIKLDEEY